MVKPEDWLRSRAFTSSHHALGWQPEESESIRQVKSAHPDRFQQGFSVIGSFPQHTSRDGDPQLHVHILWLNRVKTVSDGRWRAIDCSSSSTNTARASMSSERSA